MIFDIPVLRYTAYRIYFQKKNRKNPNQKTEPKPKLRTQRLAKLQYNSHHVSHCSSPNSL